MRGIVCTCCGGSDDLSVNAFLIALIFDGCALLRLLPQWEVVTGSYDLHYYFNPKTYKMQWSQPAGAVICKVTGKGQQCSHIRLRCPYPVSYTHLTLPTKA